MNKKDIIKLLETIATYMELKGDNPFKISAFRKAAAALETDERTLTEIRILQSSKGLEKERLQSLQSIWKQMSQAY